jgi:hypothetical protein
VKPYQEYFNSNIKVTGAVAMHGKMKYFRKSIQDVSSPEITNTTTTEINWVNN